MAVTKEQVADAMYEMVTEYTGRKQFTARDLSKAMAEKFGPECNRALCKEAVKILIESKKCVYSYKGSVYVELPKEEN